MKATMNEAGEKVGEVAVLYGDFLTSLIDFIIVGFCDVYGYKRCY